MDYIKPKYNANYVIFEKKKMTAKQFDFKLNSRLATLLKLLFFIKTSLCVCSKWRRNTQTIFSLSLKIDYRISYQLDIQIFIICHTSEFAGAKLLNFCKIWHFVSGGRILEYPIFFLTAFFYISVIRKTNILSSSIILLMSEITKNGNLWTEVESQNLVPLFNLQWAIILLFN